MPRPPDSQVRGESAGTEAAPLALQRARSNVTALQRTLSTKTSSNLEHLREFLSSHAVMLSQGHAITAKDKAVGKELVLKLCTDSSRQREAEFECFDLYLDYCRKLTYHRSQGLRWQAVLGLKDVFSYLDQQYTNTAPRPGVATTVQATSKLAPGQSLAYCAEQIEKNSNWLPLFYVTDETPDGQPMDLPTDVCVRDTHTAAQVDYLGAAASNLHGRNIPITRGFAGTTGAPWRDYL